MQVDFLETIQNPEYTGENRCEPCTALNLIIAGLFSSAVARKSRAGGLVVLTISVALIYLRGYLVPGTPTLTKKYLPPEVLRLFGKEPLDSEQDKFGAIQLSTQEIESTVNGAQTDTKGQEKPAAEPTETSDDRIDPSEFLIDHEIIEPCKTRDELCLTNEFEAAWETEINQTDVSTIDAETVSVVFGLETEKGDLELKKVDDMQVVSLDGRILSRWPSDAALVADVTAAHVLESWDDAWASCTQQEQSMILAGLRIFLETCPTDGGDVVIEQKTVDSCCQSIGAVTVTCEKSEQRLLDQYINGWFKKLIQTASSTSVST